MFQRLFTTASRKGLTTAIQGSLKPNIGSYVGSSCGSSYRSSLGGLSAPPCSSRFVSTKTPEEAIKLWQDADCVCFDVDCTLTIRDGLDSLGDFLGKGKGEAVEALSNAAMNGTMGLDEAIQKRLDVMGISLENLTEWIRAHPGESRLVPGIREVFAAVRARNKDIYLVSGAFREMIIPVSDVLNVPRENLYANRFVYMASEEDPTSFFPHIKVKTFSRDEPTSKQRGKPEAVRRIRTLKPYKTVVMIGDGITDLETIQEEGAADLFIGYGGVEARPLIKEHADWFVMHHNELTEKLL